MTLFEQIVVKIENQNKHSLFIAHVSFDILNLHSEFKYKILNLLGLIPQTATLIPEIIWPFLMLVVGDLH